MKWFRIKVALEFLWYIIRRPHRNGHGIHSPFLFAILQKVMYSDVMEKPVLVEIKKLKTELILSKETVCVDDLGAGSTKLESRMRKVRDIATISSISHKYGRLLHRLVCYFRPDKVLEMGTCLGLGTLYLATGNDQCNVVTIEGSQALAKESQANFSKLPPLNIRIVTQDFDTALPLLLKETGHFDIIFIDGNHTKEAVLRYFYECLPFAKTNTMIIIDDIRWSAGMMEAWREICKESRVRLSIDLFRLGIVFFNDKLQKEHFMIYY